LLCILFLWLRPLPAAPYRNTKIAEFAARGGKIKKGNVSHTVALFEAHLRGASFVQQGAERTRL